MMHRVSFGKFKCLGVICCVVICCWLFVTAYLHVKGYSEQYVFRLPSVQVVRFNKMSFTQRIDFLYDLLPTTQIEANHDIASIVFKDIFMKNDSYQYKNLGWEGCIMTVKKVNVGDVPIESIQYFRSWMKYGFNFTIDRAGGYCIDSKTFIQRYISGRVSPSETSYSCLRPEFGMDIYTDNHCVSEVSFYWTDNLVQAYEMDDYERIDNQHSCYEFKPQQSILPPH